MLLLFAKLASEVLKLVTVDKNECYNNHGKDVARQIQGNLLRNILMRREMMLSLKTIPLEL